MEPEEAAKIAGIVIAVGAVAGLWWLYRPETEEERELRRKKLVFQQAMAEFARPRFVESDPTVIANVQRAALFVPTSVVLVGNIASLGGAEFSVNGQPVGYPPARWLDAGYTRLLLPVPPTMTWDGTFVIRVRKNGATRVATVLLRNAEQKTITVDSMGIE